MDSGLHLPTVVVVTGAFVAGWLLVFFLRWRRRRPGFISVTDQATYETLHTASVAGRHFADGFTDEGCERAAPYLRAMLATPALAVCDTSIDIVWDGEGRHHLPAVMDRAQTVIDSGQTLVLGPDVVTCTATECPVRSAVIAPVTVEDRVIGTIAGFGPDVSAGLARAAEEVASWVAAQVE